jgi:hypothetical protein
MTAADGENDEADREDRQPNSLSPLIGVSVAQPT